MRLQVTPSQALEAASYCPAFQVEDQWNSVLAALRGLRSIGYSVVSKNDLFAVLAAMGGGDSVSDRTDSSGFPVHKSVRDFFSARSFPSPKRGMYDITSVDPYSSPEAPMPGPFSEEPSSEPLELELISVPGESWTPPSVDPSENESWYGEDAELRRMALASTPCFGSFSVASSPCGGCPLARFCAQNSVDPLAELAASLDKQTVKTIADAELRAKLGKKPSRPKPAPEPKKAVPDEAIWPSHIRPMPEPPVLGVVCSGCGESIPAGTPDCMVVSATPSIRKGGIFHRDCAKKLL